MWKELLFGFVNKQAQEIYNSGFSIENFFGTDAFIPHNMGIKNCVSIHMCTSTIGRPNGNFSGAHSFPVWLGPKDNEGYLVEAKLLEEINKQSWQGIKVITQS